MKHLALIPLALVTLTALALKVRELIRSTPSVAQVVDDALDHGDAPAVVAGSDLDPLERLFRAPAYGEGWS